MPRTRSRVLYKDGGKQAKIISYANWAAQGSTTFEWLSESVTDEVALRGDGHAFQVTRVERFGGVINRPWYNYYGSCFSNYTCYAIRVPDAWFTTHIGISTPNDFDVATTVARKTNPSRPYVDLGVLVGEMKDLPSLFRLAGESIFRAEAKKKRKRFDSPYSNAAGFYMNYMFGWKPLVDDFMKLFNFLDKFDKRVAELERLKQRGLRRTIEIGEYEATSSGSRAVQSTSALITKVCTKKTTEKVWGYITWKPDDDFPQSTQEMRRLARKAVLGLTIDAATAWELIPWSWLFDWCSSTGDYLISRRNIVKATHSPVQVMRHKRTLATFEGSSLPDNGNITRGGILTESKTRKLVSPSPNAHFPIINGREASILGSIGIMQASNGLKPVKLGFGR